MSAQPTPAPRWQPDLWDASRRAQAIAIVDAGEDYRADFAGWLRRNFHIYVAFEIRALRLIRAGCKHGGAGAVVENIRWQSVLAERESEWKCNNNWRSDLARLFEAMHPVHQGFFRSRIRRSLH